MLEKLKKGCLGDSLRDREKHPRFSEVGLKDVFSMLERRSFHKTGLPMQWEGANVFEIGATWPEKTQKKGCFCWKGRKPTTTRMHWARRLPRPHPGRSYWTWTWPELPVCRYMSVAKPVSYRTLSPPPSRSVSLHWASIPRCRRNRKNKHETIEQCITIY